jgi:hypothetical protein
VELIVKSGKLPAIQFYGGDWRKDVGVQSLSYHHRGIWFEILLLMHESERRGLLILNGRAMTDEELSRVLGLDNQNTTTAITEILTSGVASRDPKSGALMNRRMVRDQRLREIRQKAGKLGGNPALLKKRAENLDKQNQTSRDKQSRTPSSSSSASAKNSPSLRSGGKAFSPPAGEPGDRGGGKGENKAKTGGNGSGAARRVRMPSKAAVVAAQHRNNGNLVGKTPIVISATLERREKWLLPELRKFWAGLNKVRPDEMVWSDRDRAAMMEMLKAAPGLTDAQLRTCLEHRSIAVELGWLSPSLQFSKWLRDLPSFLAGPLNKYGDLLPKVGGRYKRKGDK